MTETFWLQIAKSVASAPELVKEIYLDLAKPGVQQVGKALGGILGLGNTALYHVHLLNERTSVILKVNMEKYRKQMEEIKEDDVVEVTPEIGVPIAEKLSYVSNEELSDMYINLLAKASLKSTVDQAHPGFVRFIDRLCPDEAIFLKNMKRYGDMPFVEVRLKHKDKKVWNLLHDFATKPEYLDGLTNKQNHPSYVINLSSLGILDIRRDIWMAPPDVIYASIEKATQIQLPESVLQGRILTFQRCQVKITPLGHLFMKACFSKLT